MIRTKINIKDDRGTLTLEVAIDHSLITYEVAVGILCHIQTVFNTTGNLWIEMIEHENSCPVRVVTKVLDDYRRLYGDQPDGKVSNTEYRMGLRCKKYFNPK